MKLGQSARIARRELRGGIAGFRIFLICLALGVGAIAAVGTVREAILSGLAREGATLLGGDAQMEFTYRFAAEDEQAWMTDNARAVSEIVDFRSMVVVERDGQAERGLTQVKAVDDAYPLIGEVTLSPAMPLAEALSERNGVAGAVVAPILADRLGLAPGDRFAMGTGTFELRALILSEPDNAGGGFELGPRTLVLSRALDDTGLITPGTLFSTKYRLLLEDGAALPAMQQDAETMFRDTGMGWRDSRNAAPGIEDVIEHLGAFLVLVGLAGLAVGGVGISAAVRVYLGRKTDTIATLRSVGAERQVVFLSYGLQIAVLTIAGIVLGLILGLVLPWLISPVITARLPVPLDLALYPGPLLLAALYGALTAALFTLWPLARTEDIRAATLFRDALDAAPALPRRRYLVWTLSLILLLLATITLFSTDPDLALWTAGGIMAVFVVLILLAGLTRVAAAWLARRHALRGAPAVRLALAAIASPREQSTSVLLSLGLGLTVLATIGQVDFNLRAAISRDLPEVAPSYFFVDIQNDQIDGFMERLSGDVAVTRVDTAPMLRGLITRINGRPAREIVGDHWVIEGDRGVTYSPLPPDGTKLTGGEWWPPDYDGPPQVSFAADEAAEMGLKLGDTLTINILGRDIEARLTSLREVDFSTVGIGFILSMNPSALAGAPHTFISTVYASEDAEAAILRDLAGQYPNITAIRVRDAIARVSDILRGVASAISYGAGVTLATGLVVLIGASAAGETARRYEAAILRTLGATRARILFSFALRSALLGMVAGIIALIAGTVAAWAVMRFVMESAFEMNWLSAFLIVFGGGAATVLAGLFFALRPLAARPARVLRARD